MRLELADRIALCELHAWLDHEVDNHCRLGYLARFDADEVMELSLEPLAAGGDAADPGGRARVNVAQQRGDRSNVG